MNQKQRDFLIKKITEEVKKKINILDDQKRKTEPPSLQAFIFNEVMSGRIEIISNKLIKEMVLEKARKSSSSNWMNVSRYGSETSIEFSANDFFVLPSEYVKRRNAFDESVKRINEEIKQLNLGAESLITRIQLASNSTLENMIREVDDMGNISLMQTKLKQIGE